VSVVYCIHMHPYILLNRLLSVAEGGSVLDVGAGDCGQLKLFTDAGYAAHAIDKKTPSNIDTLSHVHFETVSFVDYKPTRSFDIVFAVNVLPFVPLEYKDAITKMIDCAKVGGVVYWTYFGDRDAWNGRENIKTISRNDADEVLKSFDCEVLYRSEEEYIGVTIKEGLKNWHTIKYVIRKK
jgi:hypothetical protein